MSLLPQHQIVSLKPLADEDEEDYGKPHAPPLTPQQASHVLASAKRISLLTVLLAQLFIGSVCIAVVAGLYGGGWQFWPAVTSAACAVGVVVIPALMVVAGLHWNRSRFPFSPAALFFSFAIWQSIKVALSLLLLGLTVILMQQLDWFVFLIVLVVCFKAQWMAVWLSGSKRRR
jgi:ATP synthase protein I